MDQNLDLLKSEEHASTRKFLDQILDCGLWPMITRPTSITQRSATLIYNIYISMNLQCKFDFAILIDDISDHLPTVALLRQTKVSDKSPIEYSSCRLNAKKISQIHHKLHTIDWNRRFNEPWITKGIEAAARKNRNLYRKTLKSGCTEQDITIYKMHRNMLNRL